jgi:hypothetical protein
MKIVTAMACALMATAVTVQTQPQKHTVTEEESTSAGRRSFPTGVVGARMIRSEH